MTYGEAKAIISAKTGEYDPLQFGDQAARIQDPEERINAVIDEFNANADLQILRLDLVEDIFRAFTKRPEFEARNQMNIYWMAQSSPHAWKP